MPPCPSNAARMGLVALTALSACNAPDGSECSVNLECMIGSDCVDVSWQDPEPEQGPKERRRACVDTCTGDDECEARDICNNPSMKASYRVCKPGCRTNDDCPERSSCKAPSFLCGPVYCGDDHSICEEGERCSGRCERGCRPDDCEQGEYCGRGSPTGPFVCQEIIELTCGELRCRSIAGHRSRIEPCCVEGDSDVCGYIPAQAWGRMDLGQTECIAPLDGETDRLCQSSFVGPGCRDSEGNCGSHLAEGLCGPRPPDPDT